MPVSISSSQVLFVCEIILAILLPPLGVLVRFGICSVEFFISLVLTILGYIPGIIYSLYAIIFIKRDGEGEGGDETFEQLA